MLVKIHPFFIYDTLNNNYINIEVNIELTLPLTLDDIKFLKELAHELKTQDNVGTAKPIFFQIRENQRVYGMAEGYSDDVCLVIGDDGDSFDTVEEAISHLIEYYELEEDEVNNLNDLNTLWEIEEYCQEHEINSFVVGYKEEPKYTGVFLTRSAIEQHIKLNHYHYKEPICYADHVWRNPQLEKLLEIVEKFDTYEVEEK
jgi:RNase H-fold protein (predicted Holliday junction resolvase)